MIGDKLTETNVRLRKVTSQSLAEPLCAVRFSHRISSFRLVLLWKGQIRSPRALLRHLSKQSINMVSMYWGGGKAAASFADMGMNSR